MKRCNGRAGSGRLADDRIYPLQDLEGVRLEARILEAMNDRPAAQALRRAAFVGGGRGGQEDLQIHRRYRRYR